MSALVSLPGPDRHLVAALRVDVDEGNENTAPAHPDCPRLGYRFHFPTLRQNHRVSHPGELTVEHQISILHSIAAILQNARDFDVSALFLIDDGNIQIDGGRSAG